MFFWKAILARLVEVLLRLPPPLPPQGRPPPHLPDNREGRRARRR